MMIMHGGGETPLSAIKECRINVTPNMAMDMYRSPHLTIPYILKDEQGGLEDKSQGWIF